MRRSSFSLIFVVLGLACTNDYDQFTFSGGGPGSNTGGSAGPGPNGGGTTDGGAPSTGGMGGAPSTGGMGGEPSTGGMGGMPAVVEVPCGGSSCEVTAGEECCIDDAGASSGTCKNNCAGNEASLACNEPADCGAIRCCLEVTGSNIDQAHCAGSCSDVEICDQDNPNCSSGTCMQHPDLPQGYFACL